MEGKQAMVLVVPAHDVDTRSFRTVQASRSPQRRHEVVHSESPTLLDPQLSVGWGHCREFHDGNNVPVGHGREVQRQATTPPDVFRKSRNVPRGDSTAPEPPRSPVSPTMSLTMAGSPASSIKSSAKRHGGDILPFVRKDECEGNQMNR